MKSAVIGRFEGVALMIRDSAGKGRRVSGIDVKNVAGGFRRQVRGEEIYRLSDVLRVHTALQQTAFPVEVIEFFFLEPIGVSAFRAPFPAPNLRAAQDRIGVDDVDPDTMRSPFERKAASEVDLRGLCGAV